MTKTADSGTIGSPGGGQAVGVAGHLSLARLGRLTDVVFAATLLVLLATMTLLSGKPTTSEQAWAYVISEFELFVTFAISFLIIAYYWITHQIYFSYFKRTDKTHTLLQLIYLMFLAVMPFGNQNVGAHPDLIQAKLVASADIVAVGVMQYITWSYATSNDRLVVAGVPDAATRSALGKEALVLPAVAVAAAVAAFFYSFLWEVVLIVGPVLASVRFKAQ